MTKETIRTIIDLFINWNGVDEPIDVANIDSAVDYISECLGCDVIENFAQKALQEKPIEEDIQKVIENSFFEML